MKISEISRLSSHSRFLEKLTLKTLAIFVFVGKLRSIVLCLCPVIPLVLVGKAFFTSKKVTSRLGIIGAPTEEAALHISTKEMLAFLRVLQSSPAGLSNCRVDVNVNSQVLLVTWSRAGSKSPHLNAATKEVYHFVSERNIQLTLYKVPSKGNIAHLSSRHLSPSDSK